METELLKSWATIAALVIGGANTIWIWLRRPGEAMSLRVKECEDDLAAAVEKTRLDLKEHDRRIQAVEDLIKHLPTKDDLHKIDKTIAGLASTMEGIGATVIRMDNFLREHAR